MFKHYFNVSKNIGKLNHRPLMFSNTFSFIFGDYEIEDLLNWFRPMNDTWNTIWDYFSDKLEARS